MLYLTEDEVRRLLPMSECVALMRETFQALANGQAINQARRRLFLPSGSVLHSMAGAFGNYFGTKFYSVNVKHEAHFFFMLFDATTAQPLALMEANYLGQIRTGAVSGYATDLLARPDASTVGIVGSGFQARSQLEAILQVRPIAKAFVYSRNENRRNGFARECSDTFHIAVTPVASAGDAVREADIAVTATFAQEPVIDADDIRPGTHINAMGSNNAKRRELPAALIERANLIVVDSIEQSKVESGDLLLAWNAEDWNTPKLIELQQAATARRAPEDITIFKSNGLGVEDVAAGALVYERARAGNVGRPLYS